MKNKKTYFALIGIFFLTLSMFIPLMAQGQATINIHEPIFGTYGNYLYDLFPNAPALSHTSAINTVFTANQTAYLYYVTLQLKKEGTLLDAGLRMALVNYTGSIDAHTAYPEYPTQEAFETSSNIIYSDDLTTSYDTYTFVFNGTTLLTAGQNYSLIVYVAAHTYDDAYNYFMLQMHTAGADEFSCHYHNGGWSAIAGDHAPNMIVAGFAEAATTPLTTPTPTTSNSGNWIDDEYGATNEGIQFLTDYMPLFVPLFLILICGFLGWYFAGAWGFFAGFNVGVIVSYTFGQVELWVLVLVAVIDAVLIFGNIKLGKGE